MADDIQKEQVEVLQTLAETSTDRHWYRICEKRWSKGTFFSLERGDLLKLMGTDSKGQSYPTKMFTLPKDKKILDVLVGGINKIVPEDNGHQTKKRR